MYIHEEEKKFEPGFWVSLALHILLFLAIFFLMTKKSEQDKKELQPHQYVPAYTYSGSIKPTPIQPTKSSENKENRANPVKVNNIEKDESSESIQSVKNSDSNFETPEVTKQVPVKKTHHAPVQKSLLSASFDMLQQEQLQEISKKGEAEPIYMIGDDSQPADPLIKLLGRSLSAHFSYPRTAGELGIKGRVIIKLTLHPEGNYSNIQILQSSNNPDLDAAALYAVNSAPEIDSANRFINKPKTFVIGFIFN